MINLKDVITKYPGCLESASKLRSYLVDLYPEEKRNITIITTIFDCGIAEEIRNAKGAIDEIVISSYCNRLENIYAYSPKFSRECLLLWSDVYKVAVKTKNLEIKESFKIRKVEDESTIVSKSSVSKQAYTRDGNYIYFGTYPQTKVTDTTLTTSLNSLAGTLPTSSNSQKWTSYGYYISGSVTDYMWYIDVEYSGAKYRGVYFTSYRPNHYLLYGSPHLKGPQYENGYYTSTVYWFKYKPIKWQILEESNGYATILADLALDSKRYCHNESGRTINGRTVYDNNYAESEIRAWLNDTFYNTAFNDLQKALIQTVTVDNSASSTSYSSNSYACSNTNDKVWLLSYTEAFSKYFSSSSARTKKSSDYAKSQGCWASTSSGYEGNCIWWLRSPDGYYSYCTWGVNDYGDSTHYYCLVDDTSLGVVPALKIGLIGKRDSKC